VVKRKTTNFYSVQMFSSPLKGSKSLEKE